MTMNSALAHPDIGRPRRAPSRPWRRLNAATIALLAAATFCSIQVGVVITTALLRAFRFL